MELLIILAVVGVLATLILSAIGHGTVSANTVKCLSNQKQIGQALLNYAQEYQGSFPPTTHTTGSWRREQSWIFELAPFLGDVDAIRLCPADPPARQKRIRDLRATSYVLNDLVFDSPDYNNILKIPLPSRTLILFILSENRAPSTTRDHIHGSEWNSWTVALNDIEPDRHRRGSRDTSRLKGSANYLYADGHAANMAAADLKSFFDQGINPARVPLR